MAIIELSDGIVLIPEGRYSLKITKAEGKPKARPNVIEVEFESEQGHQLKNKYPLDPKNKSGLYVTSMLLRHALNNPTLKNFDTEDIPQLVGKFIDVEVVHNEVQRKDKDGNFIEGKTMTFANIAQMYGAGEPWDSESVEEESSNRPLL